LELLDKVEIRFGNEKHNYPNKFQRNNVDENQKKNVFGEMHSSQQLKKHSLQKEGKGCRSTDNSSIACQKIKDTFANHGW
jgi:hypothetical protein